MSNERWITYQGETDCIAGWARRLGFVTTMLRDRLKRGWTVEQAFTLPRGVHAVKRPKPGGKLYTFQGETAHLAEWARRLGIKEGTLKVRFNLGWSVEEAFTRPVRVMTPSMHKEHRAVPFGIRETPMSEYNKGRVKMF